MSDSFSREFWARFEQLVKDLHLTVEEREQLASRFRGIVQDSEAELKELDRYMVDAASAFMACCHGAVAYCIRLSPPQPDSDEEDTRLVLRMCPAPPDDLEHDEISVYFDMTAMLRKLTPDVGMDKVRLGFVSNPSHVWISGKFEGRPIRIEMYSEPEDDVLGDIFK